MQNVSSPDQIAIVGGGAAAFFAAIACAESAPDLKITIYERAANFLGKVKISGGGRCNVTHDCADTRRMAEEYPRGEKALASLLHRFSPNDTVEWFKQRGVTLKVEEDGRMFPISDSSQTIIDCFFEEARRLGIVLRARANIQSIRASPGGGFALGGCRNPGSVALLESLGHHVNPPVPSLFAFHIAAEWLNSLVGISLPFVEISVPETGLREQGPVLITHAGLSGPCILRLSAWGAQVLHDLDYHFDIRIKWLPDLSEDKLRAKFQWMRQTHPNRHVINSPFESIPARLWAELAQQSGIGPTVKWTTLS